MAVSHPCLAGTFACKSTAVNRSRGQHWPSTEPAQEGEELERSSHAHRRGVLPFSAESIRLFCQRGSQTQISLTHLVVKLSTEKRLSPLTSTVASNPLKARNSWMDALPQTFPSRHYKGARCCHLPARRCSCQINMNWTNRFTCNAKHIHFMVKPRSNNSLLNNAMNR